MYLIKSTNCHEVIKHTQPLFSEMGYWTLTRVYAEMCAAKNNYGNVSYRCVQRRRRCTLCRDVIHCCSVCHEYKETLRIVFRQREAPRCNRLSSDWCPSSLVLNGKSHTNSRSAKRSAETIRIIGDTARSRVNISIRWDWSKG